MIALSSAPKRNVFSPYRMGMAMRDSRRFAKNSPAAMVSRFWHRTVHFLPLKEGLPMKERPCAGQRA